MERHWLFRLGLGIALVLFFLGHFSGLVHIPFLDALERRLYDMRVRQTLPRDMDTRIVIVTIDDKSLAQVGRWPWRRDRMAEMVNILFDHYGVRMLGFDVVFAEPDNSSGLQLLEELAKNELADNDSFQQVLDRLRPTLDYDAIFSRSLAKRPVITGFYLTEDEQGDGAVQHGILPAPIAIVDQPLDLPSAQGFVGNLALLQEQAATGGFFSNPMVDADGVHRRAATLMRRGNELYPSFALAMVWALEGFPKLGLQVAESGNGEKFELEEIKIGQYLIPVGQEGGLLIPFRNRQESFPFVSALDVLQKRAGQAILKDAIVLVGATAPGLVDLRVTPVHPLLPGVEIHANIVSGIMDHKVRQRPTFARGFEFILLLALGVVMNLLALFTNPRGLTVATTGMVGVMILGNHYAWGSQAIDLPLASPLLFLCVFYLVQVLTDTLLGWDRERGRGK